MQNVDNFQYELPEDFEDEEIDEEMAFTEEDKQKMAKSLQKQADTDEPDIDDPLTRDDFSEDVRPLLLPSQIFCTLSLHK